jgi:hypothetical protein
MAKKPLKVKNSLIKQILKAVEYFHLQEPFTVQDIKDWVERYSIVKDNGKPYAPSTINAQLSNSDVGNRGSSNQNFKCLYSKINNGKKEYLVLPSYKKLST